MSDIANKYSEIILALTATLIQQKKELHTLWAMRCDSTYTEDARTALHGVYESHRKATLATERTLKKARKEMLDACSKEAHNG